MGRAHDGRPIAETELCSRIERDPSWRFRSDIFSNAASVAIDVAYRDSATRLPVPE